MKNLIICSCLFQPVKAAIQSLNNKYVENFLTIPQCAPIKDVVHSFWQVNRQNNPSLTETIIPKGVVEIIFNFETTDLNAQINRQFLTIPRCFIQGFHTCPVQLHITDKQTFFGVILYPAAVRHIFNFQPAESSNCIIDLTLVDDSFLSLWHYMGEQKTFNERINVFTEWLMKRRPWLTDRERAFNNFLSTQTATDLSVSEIAARLCYSPRQLSRKLYELTGMNTEQNLLYKKYLQAVNLIHYSELTLTEIAYACNFSDQSHFTKTFKTLALITPKEYMHKKSGIVGHLVQNVR